MDNQKEQPTAIAMVICDEVIDDKRTSKKSLIGLFNRITASRVPTKHKSMHIYFALTNGRGKYQVALQYRFLKDMKVLGHIPGEISFEDPNAVLECDFELVDVVFPYEGLYNFEVLIEGKPIVERKFSVGKLN